MNEKELHDSAACFPASAFLERLEKRFLFVRLKKGVHGFGEFQSDASDTGGNLFRRGLAKLRHRTEFPQKSVPTGFSHAFNLVQKRLRDPFQPELPVVGDRKPMRFVPQRLKNLQSRTAPVQIGSLRPGT